MPLATPTPCPGSGIIFSERIQDVRINAYCGLNNTQATQVADYARYAIASMPDDVHPALTMFVFGDLEQGLDLETQWRDSEGYSPIPRERLRNEWSNIAGRAYYDGIFILLDEGEGRHARSASVATIVLHELHHVAQSHLKHARGVDVGWLDEGGADAMTERQLAELGFSRLSYWEPPESDCTYPLADLEKPNSKIPFGCPYDEGKMAVSLLIEQCGENAYYQVYRESLPGRSLSRVFDFVYPFSLSDFYAAFDGYRLSGYAEKPVLCTQPIKIEATATPHQ